MKTLRINVKDKIATYHQRDGVIVCGNKGYKLTFTFDEEWDAYTWKTARFIWKGKYYDQDFKGSECSVPVINDTTEVTVGVYAGDLKTTTPAEIPCLISILCGEASITEENIQDCRDIAQQAALEAQQAAEEAKNAASVVEFPTIDVTEITGGHRLTINDADGEKTFDIMDGKNGGENGDDGATFTPSVSSNGVLSWTNDKGLTNPAPVNIKGNDGVGISKAVINETGELVVTYTNGNSITLGKVVGESGGGSGGGLTGEQLENFNEMWNWYSDQTYESMTLTISPTGKTYELGSKNTFTLEWTFSQEVSSVTVNGDEQTASAEGSLEITIEYKPKTPANGEFKYKVEGTRKDGKKESKDATCTINFHNRFYWGYALDSRSSLDDDIEESFVKNLYKTGSKGFGSSRGISFSINCPKDNYIWYAYPKRFGLGNMSMAPSGSSMYLPNGFEDPKIVSITNDSKYTEDYYVYRSINPELNQTVKVT